MRTVDGAWTVFLSTEELDAVVFKSYRGTMLGRPWAQMKLNSHFARLVNCRFTSSKDDRVENNLWVKTQCNIVFVPIRMYLEINSTHCS